MKALDDCGTRGARPVHDAPSGAGRIPAQGRIRPGFFQAHDVVLSPDKKLLCGAGLGNYPVKVLASDTLRTVAEMRSELLRSHRDVAIDTVASGVQGNGADQLNKPEGVDVGGDLVWVADTHSHRVLLFEKVR